MSSIESASMPGPEVSDKGSVDFGTKAVCLKAQSDSSRLLQSGSQMRNVPSQSSMRPSLGTTAHAGLPVLSSISTQKAALPRFTSNTVQTSPSGVLTTLARTPLSTSTVPVTTISNVTHMTASYHVPRGPAQVATIASRSTSTGIARSSVTLQPVGVSVSTSGTAFVSGIRTSSPNTLPGSTRAPSPMQQSWTPGQTPQSLNNVLGVPRCLSPSTRAPAGAATKPGPSRPLLIHAAPQKPVTLTQGTQLHISTDKTIKVPAGSVAQVVPLRPPYNTGSGFIGQSQATILQSAVPTNTVLTTPVRLNVSASSQPPLLSTQRVAVSAAGTVLTSRIAVSSVAPASSQTIAVGAQTRIPGAGISQSTIITSNRLTSSNVVPTVLPGQTRLAVQTVAGQNAILATPARLGTYPGSQIVTGQPVLTATARIANTGTTVLSTSKPLLSQSLATTPTPRLPNHQAPPRAPTSSAMNSRLVRPSLTAATATLAVSNITTARPQTGIVVHPQIMVNTSCGPSVALKPAHPAAPNHLAPSRPLQIHNSSTTQKVITQPIHGPIQITQSPVSVSPAAVKPVSQAPSHNAVPTTITTISSKQMCYTPTTSVATRPVAMVASQSKILPQGSIATSTVDVELSASQPAPPVSQSSSVYIQASHRNLSSPGLVCTQPSAQPDRTAPTLSTFTLPSGASYYYEAPSGYQLAEDSPLVARPLSPDTPLVSRQLSCEGPLITRPYTPGSGAFASQASSSGGVRSSTLPSHGLVATSQPMRFNPVMIVDQSGATGQSGFANDNSTLMVSESALIHQSASGAVSKLTSSPRPSILRKRDNEASPAKAAKNLTPLLSSASASRSASPSPPSLHLETNQPTHEHGPSSNGSTTISATSSPGLDDHQDSSMPAIKTEFNDDSDRPPVEMSPRKKPRKQLLNDANDSIEMEFISDDRLKKEREELMVEVREEKVYVVKRPSISLLNSYKHNWKSRHNHFLRYGDVKPKEERRPTVTDLANQKHAVQKVNGWKIYHLNTQMEDLSDMESHVLDRLSTMLRAMDKTLGKELDKDVNRVNELIMSNIQRSKVIKDQMHDARTQLMKVFDHKVHVSEIISRCASKRNFKKREKY